MLKVTNKLKLNDDATEESIVSAIEAVENRAAVAEEALTAANKKSQEELDKMKNDLDEMENKFKEKCKEYEDCKNELDKEQEAKNKIAEEALDAKVKDLVENAVKEGKIKNEATVIDGWKAQAKANFDSAKAMIEGIATNKKAAKFTIASKEGESAVKYPSVGQAMAKLSIEMDKKK